MSIDEVWVYMKEFGAEKKVNSLLKKGYSIGFSPIDDVVVLFKGRDIVWN